jgi:hypothetical protein
MVTTGLLAAALVSQTTRGAETPVQPETFEAKARGFGDVKVTLQPLGEG